MTRAWHAWSGQQVWHRGRMNEKVDMLLLRGVARPCPDCAEERLFVPADLEQADYGEFCCTWCGAGLLIDPAHVSRKAPVRDVA
jgi:hypothetical protein